MYSIISHKVFLHGDSHGAINHSRIRMGLSGLNQQRKSYNFINDCSCQLCGNVCEDAMHYLLFCRSYRALRIELLGNLTLRFPNLFEVFSNYKYDKVQAKNLLEYLINGTGNFKQDEIIFSYVHKYIQNSQRFM